LVHRIRRFGDEEARKYKLIPAINNNAAIRPCVTTRDNLPNFIGVSCDLTLLT
jgi:hypothetical protein